MPITHELFFQRRVKKQHRRFKTALSKGDDRSMLAHAWFVNFC